MCGAIKRVSLTARSGAESTTTRSYFDKASVRTRSMLSKVSNSEGFGARPPAVKTVKLSMCVGMIAFFIAQERIKTSERPGLRFSPKNTIDPPGLRRSASMKSVLNPCCASVTA